MSIVPVRWLSNLRWFSKSSRRTPPSGTRLLVKNLRARWTVTAQSGVLAIARTVTYSPPLTGEIILILRIKPTKDPRYMLVTYIWRPYGGMVRTVNDNWCADREVEIA